VAEQDARVHLADLLARHAAEDSQFVICNGRSCMKCEPTHVRCQCTAQSCPAKVDAHRLQPYVRRRGYWPPPGVLFVRIERARGNDAKVHTPVAVPTDTFPVRDLFARPPGGQRAEWSTEHVYYRAVAAGYHNGPSSRRGHYWAIVRGAYGNGNGFRRCDDPVVQTKFDPGTRWDDVDAERRLAFVALERVRGPDVKASPSEVANRLASSGDEAHYRRCGFCGRLNAKEQHVCPTCLEPLSRL